jgi:hypothetical protein
MVSNPQQLLTRACLGRSNTMRQTRPDNHREERIKDSLLQKKLSLAAAAGPDRRHHPERWLYLDRARSQRTPHPSPAPPPPPSPPYQAGSPSAARGLRNAIFVPVSCRLSRACLDKGTRLSRGNWRQKKGVSAPVSPASSSSSSSVGACPCSSTHQITNKPHRFSY